MKQINVLSLFNGMSTGHFALDNLGIEIGKYYSSEIKKAALIHEQHHFPNNVQLGNISNWRLWETLYGIDWSSIDLILSGSPCKDLSVAGKREGIFGGNSGLFWHFVDILNHVKELNPDVKFLQENVYSAPKKDIGIMSRALGVYPVMIDSALVTAQMRKRWYWTNIKTRQYGMFGDLVSDIQQPKDRGIMFSDIIESGFVTRDKSTCILEGYVKKNKFKDELSEKSQAHLRKRNGIGMCPIVYVTKEKASCLLESESRPHKNAESIANRDKKGFTNAVFVKPCAIRGRKNKDGKIVQKLEVGESDKANCLTTVGKDSLVYIEQNEVRVKTNTKKGYDVLDKGDVLNLAFPSSSSSRRGRVTKGKSPCLLAGAEPLYTLDNFAVRLLTQTELERLQGFLDGNTSMLSRNQAASLLGDGWTLPVIEHILQYLTH